VLGALPPVLINIHAVVLNKETITTLQNNYIKYRYKNIYIRVVRSEKFVGYDKNKICDNVLGQTKIKTNELCKISKNAMGTCM
jgi:hypothetical protein